MEIVFEETDRMVMEAGGTRWLEMERSSFRQAVRPVLRPGYVLFKRALDVVGAFIGLVLLLPVGLLIALLVKLDSPGPVFFRQNRLSKDYGSFKMLKFRSMYQNADERLAELLRSDKKLREEYERFHKLRDDPRITRVGRFLRKYSLDEFPQLINVLRGDMSLVGPRPYMHREINKMGPYADTILSMQPGLSGLWQTQGRNALSFEERLQLDEEYVKQASFWLDVRLIFLTIPALMAGE
jgi:lipopolysaccharide/colanic/teichoic acid biosynthesis glycosyltransferase